MYVLLHRVGQKRMSSVEMKGREWCQLPSVPLLDETESGVMCCMHICVMAFAMWQDAYVMNSISSRTPIEAWQHVWYA